MAIISAFLRQSASSNSPQKAPKFYLKNQKYRKKPLVLGHIEFKHVLICLFSSISFIASAQLCHPDDRLALERLRDLTNGGGGVGSWNTVTNIPNGLTAQWNGTNVHEWHGIDTMHDASFPTFYRIRKIDLDGTKFQGIQRLENALPDSIFVGNALEHCDSLILSNNELTGISGNLKTALPFVNHRLKHINLNDNLFVTGNNDQFNYILSNFGNIQELFFDRVMTGASAISSYGFPGTMSLKYLHLENNGFTGSFDLFNTTTVTYEGMQELYLSDNNLTSINIPSNASNSNLWKLYLHNNDIASVTDMANIMEFLPSLQVLKASSAMDENLGLTMVANGSSFPIGLFHIDLSSNGFVNGIPIEFLEDIPNLTHLDLSSNSFAHEMLPPLNPLPSGPFTGIYAYEGTANLVYFNLSNNNMVGDFHLDWVLLAQLTANAGNAGLNCPLLHFNFAGNDFREVLPNLSQNHIAQVFGAFSDRFDNLQTLSVEDNSFDFKDLFRIKKFFRLKQVNILLQDHYIPQSGSLPGDFAYAPQDSVGIGGLKRRNIGHHVVIEAGRHVVEEESGGPRHVLRNRYTWERVDGGFFNIGTVLPGGGFSGPGGPGYHPANGNLGDSLHQHTLGIQGLDSANHHNQRYTACVENDSFPFLTICMKQKKIEVGECLDDAGRPIDCQKMIVQFDPTVLASLTPTEQDSLKAASAASIGATPVATCVCGDLELWEISDTASTMSEGFGKRNHQYLYLDQFQTRTTERRTELCFI